MPTVPSPACAQRTEEFRRRVVPLPGSVPRDNQRPMNVALAHDHETLGGFLRARHPHIAVELWQQRARDGWLRIDGRVVHDLAQRVRSGNQVMHTVAQEIEPEVNVNVTFIHEDSALVVVSKPAPLAMHPCGRYNRNSLLPLLVHEFGPPAWHPVHRLDADTTGLLVLAKTRTAAAHLGKQFEARTVNKVYLARVKGTPTARLFSCDLPLSEGPEAAGKRSVGTRTRHGKMVAACTTFELLASVGEESLLSAAPSSGRTNQIRVHLAALGLPIVGDESYGGGETFTSGRSLLCLHAWRLAFAHPDDNRTVEFVDQWPAFAAAADDPSRP